MCANNLSIYHGGKKLYMVICERVGIFNVQITLSFISFFPFCGELCVCVGVVGVFF